jgi:hypothetical protein
MKIIKLDKRHRYYKHGFTAAIKCEEGLSSRSRNIENWLISRYGPEPWYQDGKNNHPWVGFIGRADRKKFIDRWKLHPYWICVKNEAVLTMVILSMDNL